jgi:hypothetical protein
MELRMTAKTRFPVQEAVARFFPVGVGYDRLRAARFIKWLEGCGYEIVPRREPSLVPKLSKADQHPLAADS